jgi:hypothetical protein
MYVSHYKENGILIDATVQLTPLDFGPLILFF